MIRILLVDDEPHVLKAIGEMLTKQREYICQVQTADSAAKALDILKSTTVDLLISDICMPGLTGVDLVACVARMQPQCKLIFLSAYSEFDYAYSGIKYGVLDYILKTENDEIILQSIFKVLALIEVGQKQTDQPDPASHTAPPIVEDVLFATIMEHSSLTLGECAAIFRTLGFKNEPALLLFAQIAAPHSANDVNISVLSQLIEETFQSCPLLLRSCILQKAGLLLLQFFEQPELLQITRQLSSVLRLYAAQCGHSLYVDIVQLEGEYTQIQESYTLLKNMESMKREPIRSFSLSELRKSISRDHTAYDSADTLISFIRSYIDQHIHEEITLEILAQKTGYSSDYLSVIFKQRTGESYHRFLCRQKMNNIKTLMLCPELSLDDVRIMAGFKSRSYFNHFIKKEAAMPPRQLRNTLLKK